jgi:hypothetical protein
MGGNLEEQNAFYSFKTSTYDFYWVAIDHYGRGLWAALGQSSSSLAIDERILFSNWPIGKCIISVNT